jgi:hypothetical protein
MDARAIKRLKNELLKKKSHDIFKNVQALFDLAYSTKDMELGFVVRKICAEKSKKFKIERPEHAENYRQLYRKTLLFAAPVDFDSYCQYLEWTRDPNKHFHLSKRTNCLWMWMVPCCKITPLTAKKSGCRTIAKWMPFT